MFPVDRNLKAFSHPVPVDDHINRMANDRVWGTDLEIHAAASLWQVKIYDTCVYRMPHLHLIHGYTLHLYHHHN